jgi:hypothetical protein
MFRGTDFWKGTKQTSKISVSHVNKETLLIAMGCYKTQHSLQHPFTSSPHRMLIIVIIILITLSRRKQQQHTRQGEPRSITSVTCYCEIRRTWAALISGRKAEWAGLKLWSEQDGAGTPRLCPRQLAAQGIRSDLNNTKQFPRTLRTNLWLTIWLNPWTRRIL